MTPPALYSGGSKNSCGNARAGDVSSPAPRAPLSSTLNALSTIAEDGASIMRMYGGKGPNSFGD